jgi:hypothetical protein
MITPHNQKNTTPSQALGWPLLKRGHLKEKSTDFFILKFKRVTVLTGNKQQTTTNKKNKIASYIRH